MSYHASLTDYLNFNSVEHPGLFSERTNIFALIEKLNLTQGRRVWFTIMYSPECATF